MSDPNEETVHINLPAILGGNPAGIEGDSDDRDTVRIHLPARPPSNGVTARSSQPVAPGSEPPEPSKTPLPVVPSAGMPPPPPPLPTKPPSWSAYGKSSSLTSRSSASPLREPKADQVPSAPSDHQEPRLSAPKNETARVSAVPATIPQIAFPTSSRIPAGVSRGGDGIPTPLTWALLLISGAILIIQIWNYFMI